MRCQSMRVQKVTGNDLKYAVMMGKPSEFTFRYAEYVVSLMAKKLGYKRPINRLYMLGYVLSSSLFSSLLISSLLSTSDVCLCSRAATTRWWTSSAPTCTASICGAVGGARATCCTRSARANCAACSSSRCSRPADDRPSRPTWAARLSSRAKVPSRITLSNNTM